jgi:alkylhydroperoxidase family enzyme
MRLNEPRLPALQRDEWNDKAAEVMAKIETSGEAFNVYKTMANVPDLFKRWVVFATHIMFKNSLSIRDRELLILRIGWLTKSGYEYSQHVRIALENGFTEADIERVKNGSGAEGWDEKEGALVKAAEELRDDSFISDATWTTLSKHFSTENMADIIFTVGNYNMLAMALNSFGVQLDDHLVDYFGEGGKS